MKFSADELAKMDRDFSWHPFTPMQGWCDPNHDPVILVEGNGALLRDSRGREYLDGNSSIWTNLHGHGNPKIVAAIHEQLAKVAHVSYLGTGNEPASILASRLVGLFPPETLERVFFSDDGSTAIEVAVKMAAQFWQQNGSPGKNLFVAFDRAYHGDTTGAASLGGVPLFHDRFANYHFPVQHVGSVEELAALPALAEGRVAGVVLEPLIQGVNRMHLWPKGMLKEVREICSRYDTFLILDEVMTGFGRTGTMFACEQEKVIPDFLCLAKGLTGGLLPLAATLTTNRVFAGFLGHVDQKRTFFYGHSYTANPLGCAAALANLDIFAEEKTLETINRKAKILAKLLHELQEACPLVREVRQLGLIAGIDLAKADGSPFLENEQVGIRVCQEARLHGLLTRNIGDTIVLMPSYCTTESQLEQMSGALRISLRSVLQADEPTFKPGS